MSHCLVCNEAIKDGECITDVPLAPGEHIAGHYWCVFDALGPERALAAISKKILPVYTREEFEGRKLKSYLEALATVRGKPTEYLST